jgi:hypothetical protein
MLDNYEDELKEIGYFWGDSQNPNNHFWCLGFCFSSNVKPMDLGLFWTLGFTVENNQFGNFLYILRKLEIVLYMQSFIKDY